MKGAVSPALPDPYWVDAAAFLERYVEPGDLLLAPGEFLAFYPGTIALHVRKRMLPVTVIEHFVLHKGMLDLVDPVFLSEAAQLTPIFANEVIAIYSRRGDRLSAEQANHLPDLGGRLYSAGGAQPATSNTAVVVTTYNRPWALRRTLASVNRERRPIVVVDDGSSFAHHLLNFFFVRAYGCLYVHYPVNLGLANAINVGVGHWLAHPHIEWVSVFNDDVEVVSGIFEVLAEVAQQSSELMKSSVYTGYFDDLHAALGKACIGRRSITFARSCSAKHLHAHRDYWQAVLPAPTAYLGAPKKGRGLFPGQGSDADWWIASWSPQAAPKRGGVVVAIPNLVSTFAKDVALSTWGNGK